MFVGDSDSERCVSYTKLHHNDPVKAPTLYIRIIETYNLTQTDTFD